MEADEKLEKYLSETSETAQVWPRVFCCESSRSFYCPICCRILIPRDDWPATIREGKLQLPFDIDIILDAKERRTSSTGIMLVSMFSAIESSARLHGVGNDDTPSSVRLYDLEKESIPDYEPSEQGVYVLFPDKESVPVSSVEVRKLIVLDMKWSKQTLKMDPSINTLPKVHLESPPSKSRYWRWHNSGKGMLSSIEAVFFAAMEAASNWPEERRDSILDIMWLFALQYAVIQHRSSLEDRAAPSSDLAKEVARELRKKQSGNPPKKKMEPTQFYSDLKL